MKWVTGGKSQRLAQPIFIPLFLLAIAANFASYATIKGMPPFPSSAVWQAMLWWFMLLLSVMGGRVIPFFTARRFQFTKAEPILALDVIANGSLLALFVLSFFPLTMAQLGQPLMLVAGVAQLIRFYVGSLGVLSVSLWCGHCMLPICVSR